MDLFEYQATDLVATHGVQSGNNVLGIATSAHAGSRYVVYGEISVPRAL